MDPKNQQAWVLYIGPAQNIKHTHQQTLHPSATMFPREFSKNISVIKELKGCF